MADQVEQSLVVPAPAAAERSTRLVISSCAVASFRSGRRRSCWKLQVAVGEADGNIENTSEATHNAALSPPRPGIAPAIDAAIPAPPAK